MCRKSCERFIRYTLTCIFVKNKNINLLFRNCSVVICYTLFSERFEEFPRAMEDEAAYPVKKMDPVDQPDLLWGLNPKGAVPMRNSPGSAHTAAVRLCQKDGSTGLSRHAP